MKKLLSTILAAVVALAAMATDYTGTLTVTVNGESTNQESTISLVDNGSNSYTLSINNFQLEGIPIGNIVVTAPGSTSNGLTSLITSQDITITAGNDPNVEMWFGPELGIVPINMVLAFNEFAMTTNIDIYMAELGQTINVKFAQDGELTGYQIKNSRFENFKSNGEPLAWHGFKSATGTWAGLAPGSLQSSNDCHTGSYSALMKSGSLFNKVGNGTMTTGRLNAGSTTPSDVANHSAMDISNTNTDANNDPYYTIIHGRPDAINFWVKFVPKNSSDKATMSAIITNGTAYQDPENPNTTYNNKLATAKNNTIPNGGWSEFTVPFNYINENVDGKALLVTFSTNATPGGGNDGDALYVDDIALVYNAAISGIKIKGTALANFSQDVYEYNLGEVEGEFADADIEATKTTDCPHAYLVKKAVSVDGGYKLFVAVIGNDLNTIKVYTINVTTPVTAVELEGVTFSETKKWATWIGDQDLAVPANVTASVVTGINGDVAQIESLDYIPAGVGVLLHSITAASNITTEPFTGTSTVTTNLLNGSANGTTPVPTGAYLLYNDCFYLSQDGSTLDAHRCYLQLPSNMQNAPRMLKLSDSTVTAIETIGTSSNGPARYYDLNGREVNERATGILLRRNPNGTVTKIVK